MIKGLLATTSFSLLLLLSPLTPAAEQITLQLKWHHQFQFAGYYAAKHLGYYQEEGLDVTINAAKPGDDSLDIVLQGKADYGVGSNSLLLSYNQGIPVVALAVIFQHSPYVLLTRSDTEVQSIHDLADKRIMLEPQADELIAYLKQEGVPLSSLQQLKHSFDAKSLTEGDTEIMSAYITDEPYYLDKQHINYFSFTPRSAGIDFYGDNLFTTRKEIEQQPERVKAFRSASLRGWQYAMDHPEEITELILREYDTPKTRDQLLYEAQKMRSLIHPELIEIGYMLPGRWRHIVQTYATLGMMPANLQLDNFLYDTTQNNNHSLYKLYLGLGAITLLCCIVIYIAWRFSQLLKNREKLLQLKNQHANIGEAINHISHQWKQPLNSLSFQLMRIEQSAINDSLNREEIIALAERGQNTLQFMADTVDTFSYFLKTNQKAEWFDPAETIRGVVQLLQDSLDAQKIIIEFEEQQQIKLFGKAADLAQVLLSILVNARSVLTEREVTNPHIKIILCRDKEGDTIRISDNGGGVKISPASSIFELGVSAQNGDSERGLGLYVAKSLIEKQLKGNISVTNRIDKDNEGAEFIIRIPYTPNS